MGFLFILLQILKWIGIVLGGIVALALLIVLLILFVPFRYKLEGEKYDSITAKGRVTWLLHLVRFTAEYKSGSSLVTKLKVLFFTISDSESKPKEDDAGVTDEELESSEDYQDLVEEENGGAGTSGGKEESGAGKPEETGESAPAEGKEGKEGEEKEESPGTTDGTENAGAEKTEAESAGAENAETESAGSEGKGSENGETKERKNIGEILQDINDKVLDIFEKPQQLIDRIYVLEKKRDLITEFIEDPQNRKVVALGKKVLIKLLKAILPKKGSGNIRFGTGDPASTGQILAALAVLYVPLGGKLKVKPEFEEAVFEGEAELKGRIYLITIVVLFLKVWFNRDFKAAKQKFEKLKKQLKKADKKIKRKAED